MEEITRQAVPLITDRAPTSFNHCPKKQNYMQHITHDMRHMTHNRWGKMNLKRSEHSIHGYHSRRFCLTERILGLNVKYFVLFAEILRNTTKKYARNITFMGII